MVASRLLTLLCFLAGLSSLGWILNRGHAVPELEEVSDKLEFYRRAKGAYSAVFFGSSKTYLGFDPLVFDAELAKRGVKMKTLNFGVDAMMIPESGYVCTHLLERFPEKPRYIFMEATVLRWPLEPAEIAAERFQYWHDARRTFQVSCEMIENVRQWTTPNQRLGRLTSAQVLLAHFQLFARRSFCIGKGASYLPRPPQKVWTPPRDPRRHPDPAREGYFPITTTLTAAQTAALQAQLRTFGQPPPRPPTYASTEAAYRSLDRQLQRLGIKLILVAMPDPAPVGVRPFRASSGEDRFFAFDRPDLYPELYLPAHRESLYHLNTSGAPVFSTYLAEVFAQWLERHGEGR